MGRTVESWWNGRSGALARAQLRLYAKDNGTWTVEREDGRSAEFRHFRTEEEARDSLESLMSRPWEWRRMDDLYYR